MCLDSCRWNVPPPRNSRALAVTDGRSDDSRPPQEPQTTLCVEHTVYNRKCPHGPLCVYSHHMSELGIQTPINVTYKIVPCLKYLHTGKCHLGRMCQFAHVNGKLDPRFWVDLKILEIGGKSIDDKSGTSSDQKPSSSNAGTTEPNQNISSVPINKPAAPKPPINREQFRRIDFCDFGTWLPYHEARVKPFNDTDPAPTPPSAPASRPALPSLPTPESFPESREDKWRPAYYTVPPPIRLMYNGPEPTPDRGNNYTPCTDDYRYPLPPGSILANGQKPLCVPTRNRDNGFDPFFY